MERNIIDKLEVLAPASKMTPFNPQIIIPSFIFDVISKIPIENYLVVMMVIIVTMHNSMKT